MLRKLMTSELVPTPLWEDRRKEEGNSHHHKLLHMVDTRNSQNLNQHMARLNTELRLEVQPQELMLQVTGVLRRMAAV
jgi:hypothetical protein